MKLPFLGIELPLLAFFLLAPILFVIVHAYTLVHLVMLTDKAKRYHETLNVQIKDANGEEAEQRKVTRDKLRRQLPSNIFIQLLFGPSDLRKSAFGWLLRAIAWITLVVAPVLALLIIQIQFLPYHNGLVAWTQRIALLFDLALVWWLWRKVISGGESQATAPRASSIAVGMGVLFSLLAIAFSCAIATFPGEWQDDLLPTWAVTTHNGLFSAEPDEFTHRRFPFSNTLVLPGLNVYEGLGIDDPEKAKWRDYVFRPRGRDLRGAISPSPVCQASTSPAPTSRARVSLAPTFRARRSTRRSFRARSSMARSFRARRSLRRSFRARGSLTRSSRARGSLARSFRARWSLAPSFKGCLSRARL